MQAVRRDEGEGTGVDRWLAYRFAPPTNHLPVPQRRAGAFHRAFASGDGMRKFDGSVRLEQLSRASDTRGWTVYHLCCLSGGLGPRHMPSLSARSFRGCVQDIQSGKGGKVRKGMFTADVVSIPSMVTSRGGHCSAVPVYILLISLAIGGYQK
ncbi:hypothetical protein C8Q72DRAFT_800179 [Fomitopsis betulina]|nr:hypothetical protein C8Q72DRAFT_800179 [Fomitopsis betulina]